MKVTISICLFILFYILFISYEINNNVSDTEVKKPETITKSIIYSPDGRYITAVDTEKNLLNLADIKTGKMVWKIKPDINITSISFSPDSKSIAITDDFGKIEIIQIDTGKVIRIL